MNLFTKIILTFFVYIIVYFIFFAFSFPTPDGDSINYHIPIAKSFLDGNFINPDKIEGVPYLKYSPGSSESILALLLFLKIPMQFFNVIGVLFLFISCYFLAKRFHLDKNLSLVYAVSISTLPVMLRWINMQIIDIWVAGFFTFTLFLLESPKKNLKYFFILGTSVGMLIGSKFSGLLFATVLFILYFKKIIKILDLKRFLFFIIPFFIFGLFWYIRNYYFTGNPLYPQSFLFFKGTEFHILRTQVWEVSFLSFEGFKKFANAGFSEYSLWFFALPFAIFILYRSIKKRKISKIAKLEIIGIINFIIFLFLPSDVYFHIFVSVIRYSFPVIIPIILAVFLYAKEKKREDFVYLVTFISMLASPIYEYHPKVLLIVFPIALVIFFIFPSAKSENKLK